MTNSDKSSLGGQAALPSRPLRVLMLAPNDVLSDSRIMRQAKWLAENGIKLRLLGVRDESTPARGNWDITWIPGLRGGYRAAARHLSLSGAGLALVSVVCLAIWIASERAAALYACVLLASVTLALLLSARSAMRRGRDVSQHAEPEQTHPPRTPRQSSGRRFFRRFAHARLIRGALFEVFLRGWRKRRFVAEALTREFDLVHCHEIETISAGVEIGRRTGTPVIFDAHELYHATAYAGPVHSVLNRLAFKRNAPRVQGFITVSAGVAEAYRQLSPHSPPAVLVRNAAASPRPAEPYDGRLHYAAQLDRDIRIALYQGSIQSHRGLEDLVESARSLPWPWAIVFLGNGPLSSRLKSQASDIENVRFVPAAPYDELLSWTQGATLGLIPHRAASPSITHSAPNKLWEYAAAGVPILTTRLPEVERLIGGTGIAHFIDESWAPPEMAAMITGLEQASLAHMRTACLRFCQDETWDKYAQRMITLYEELS